jgi:hypothetical protein
MGPLSPTCLRVGLVQWRMSTTAAVVEYDGGMGGDAKLWVVGYRGALGGAPPRWPAGSARGAEGERCPTRIKSRRRSRCHLAGGKADHVLVGARD